tara:strand:+ start:2102 stop:4096 length:1995 start_codon:yes stop_codon:yes gene_type:complete
MAAELLTPGVIKTKELIELFEKYGIKVGTKVGNASRLAGVYGIKKPKEVKVQYTGQSPTTIKNPTQFYIKPTDSQLKQIKKQYDINQLKRTEGGPGKEAFEKRKKRAKQLLKTGKYTISQANEILKSEFPEIKKTGMQTTLSKLAKNIKGIPSGVVGDTATSVVKVKKDLEKLNNSEIKNLIKAGNTRLETLAKKTSRLLGVSIDLAERRLGQLIDAYSGDERYIKPKKDDLFLRGAAKLTKGLGDVTKRNMFGGTAGGIQRMGAEGRVAKALGKTRAFFSSLRKRIQERIPGTGYETDEIKNIRSSARFGTSPYSLFVQGIKSDINQEKAKAFDKQTSIYEKRLQEADPKDKPKIAKEYNEKARKFEVEANKNLKSGQLPVRTLRISFDEPNKVIKNKTALNTYGDMFDDIYKKHGYSFRVPADVKTIEEVKPFLEGGRGYKQALNLIRAGAPRIFAIPAAAYLGYQALGSSELEAAEPETPIKYSDEAGAFIDPKTEEPVSNRTMLEWAADNPMPTAAIASAPLLSKTVRQGTGKLLKGLLSTLASPLAATGFAGATIKENLDEGKNIVDATVDPMVGIELLYPEAAKRIGAKGITGALGKALSLGRVGAMLTPAGLGITALGLGKMGYNALQAEKEKLAGMSDEEREAYLAQAQEQMDLSA